MIYISKALAVRKGTLLCLHRWFRGKWNVKIRIILCVEALWSLTSQAYVRTLFTVLQNYLLQIG